MIREGNAVPNIIDQMEVHIFAAQLARLSRLTGKTCLLYTSDAADD